MNKLIFFFVLASLSAFAQETSTTDVEEGRWHNPYKSHWVTTFGAERLAYPLPFNFSGSKKSFQETDRELFGGRVGLGREFYLGKRVNTVSKVEGYYVGTLFERAINAGPDESSVEFTNTKKSGSVWGFDIGQSLGMIFEMKTKNPMLDQWTYLTVEPFIEAGAGVARGYNRQNYRYRTSDYQEAYRHRITDEMNSTHYGIGINFTSRSGFFLQLKATQYNYLVSKREEKIYNQPHGSAATTREFSTSDIDLDPVTVYALGGGYKF